jgi:protein-tyrosine-phosphatase
VDVLTGQNFDYVLTVCDNARESCPIFPNPTEEDIRRFSEYQREVTVLETKWDALVRKFKEGLVVTVTLVAHVTGMQAKSPLISKKQIRIAYGR